MRRLLQSQQAQLDQINHNTASLRKQYPQSSVPDSIFDNRRSANSIYGAADSVLGAEDFAFDDDIVNSKAYRRAMALAQAQFDKLDIADADKDHLARAKDDASTAERPQSGSTTSLTEQVEDNRPTVVPGAQPIATLAWSAPINSRLSNNDGSHGTCSALFCLSIFWARRSSQERPFVNALPEPKILRASTLGLTVIRKGCARRTSFADATFRLNRYRTFTSTIPLDGDLPRLDYDWASAFELKKADMEGRSKQEVEHQNVLFEILESEHQFINNLGVLSRLYVDPLLNAWPKILDKPSKFADQAFAHLNAIREAHEHLLYLPMLACWERQGAWAKFTPEPFAALADSAEATYIAFSQNFNLAQATIEEELAENPQFRQFIETRRQHPWSQKLGWDSYLKFPLTRLQRYRLLLAVLGRTTSSPSDKADTVMADSKIVPLLTMVESTLRHGQRELQLKPMEDALSAEQAVEIGLSEPLRRFVKSGKFPVKTMIAGDDKWRDCDVTLLDNALIITSGPLSSPTVSRKASVVVRTVCPLCVDGG
ncbi:Rho guanine nucleotide exchange factor [Elasticomyces elasticus]|nr:Rho guanine nucleotide exchange factor [Elasticomyces elasticus]